ncbi:MAG: ORF6N domain-containing protein [Patescibacteria group bacterium]
MTGAKLQIKNSGPVSIVAIEQRIFTVRGRRVMLDSDLAVLYGVRTKALNQALRRNLDRFPEDFAFQLTKAELKNLKSQIVTSSSSHGGRRTFPWVFADYGVVMLASVLRSDRAVQASIQIARAFVRLRELLVTHSDLARRIEKLEKRYDESFAVVFSAIKRLMDSGKSRRRKIGFDIQ